MNAPPGECLAKSPRIWDARIERSAVAPPLPAVDGPLALIAPAIAPSYSSVSLVSLVSA